MLRIGLSQPISRARTAFPAGGASQLMATSPQQGWPGMGCIYMACSPLCGTTRVLPTETTRAQLRAVPSAPPSSPRREGPVCAGWREDNHVLCKSLWRVMHVPSGPPVQCFRLASKRPKGSLSHEAIRAMTTLRPAHAPCIGRSGPSSCSTWSIALLLAQASVILEESTEWVVPCADFQSFSRLHSAVTTMQGSVPPACDTIACQPSYYP